MPRENHNLGKNDPMNHGNRRGRQDSDSEDEERERTTTTTTTTALASPPVSLPQLMFHSSGAGSSNPPLPAPERPMDLSHVQSILRDVLEMLENDDFSDLDGSSSSSRGGGGGSVPRNDHSDEFEAQ
ncbi:expressed unknown protein [Seminavis robusta]|uniref:Uncharacterized protein n=1 Tax=Seminavis robusta TaxID=568900 RepID=A0A9N8HWZ8_9STRA|nr:expressed unknown protein [Seminavis robusta]|eukprot:Sro2348_g324290.1 n/a (127) ;mRNA; r:585-965